MIKAISFDFYNTLVRFWPPLDEIQQAACKELGLNVSKVAVERGYVVADEYFNRENEASPIALRTNEDRRAFFGRYEQIILETAGVPVSVDLAQRVWEVATFVPKDFIAFEDVIPALKGLRSQGYRMGILSNLRLDIGPLCDRLGLSPYLDFCISATDAGTEKPHRPIFLTALEKMAAAPREAVHVGDQYRSDVLGARAAGIHSVLIDRNGWNAKINDCPRVASLFELDELLANAPQSLTANHHGP